MVSEIISRWRMNTNERKQLQMVYLALFITMIVIAGLFSLVNSALGSIVLMIALGLIALYTTNIIVWALVSMALVTLDQKQRKPASTSSRRK